MRYVGDGDARNSECVANVRTSMGYTISTIRLGVLAAELRADCRFTGWGALKDLDNTPEIEVGYRLMRVNWGVGFATEIARALVTTGF